MVAHVRIFVATAFVLVTSAAAQETIPLTRLTTPIDFDGQPFEEAWDQVEPLVMTMFSPSYGAPLTEETDIRVGYDNDYIYLGARMYDDDVSDIRSNTLYRDTFSGDDLVAIILDSYNDYETAVWFVVNPAGARSDRSMSNDAEFGAGMPMNADWNSFWDVQTSQDERGWYSEMRIPFSSLPFQDVDGRVSMGMIVYRYIAGKNERHLYPAIPNDFQMAFAKPSESQRITLEGVYSQKPVYFTPYVLGGSNRIPELNTAGTAYLADNDVTREAGLDVKWNPSSNVTVDLTANTDFAQVEADDQQVNLTRFSLFFPEKRQFFQERAAVFDFNTGGFSRLFHSRQIGLSNGSPIRILGGARAVARTGGTDIGVLAMQAASDSPRGIPTENFGVVRFKSTVFNPYSTIGGITTSRIGENGAYNVAVGADAIIRPFGDEYFTLKVVKTFDDQAAAGADFIESSRVIARWERRTQNGFGYTNDFIRSGSGYNPGIGFDFRSDYMFAANHSQYRKIFGADGPLNSASVDNRSSIYFRNSDKSVQSAAIVPKVSFEWKSNASLNISVENTYESVRNAFQISGGPTVPVGDYWFHALSVHIMRSRNDIVRGDFNGTVGQFYDGTLLGLSVGPTWNASQHLELSGQYQFNAVRFDSRGESLDSHLGQIKIQAALDIHLQVSTLVQYSNTADAASINSRLRYHFREGQDLWLVYNEGFNTDRPLSAPRLPLSGGRAMMIK
jgi:hypothetical protein